ncbi:MAG: competence protein CoiA family protein [Lentilactobacillus hilgardii]|uniref:competence protein CoiA n=1 Tax=Lentilactobacillus hilgardii TaxID=1588 RepID=UPI001CC1FE19|nr:competence protein CoiA family protein [Lentilactobacillus hilgardii]MBZ2200685.1 CoiA family competence protein [Lentilactobacillus hilgardii]MBZ2203501.1 CoiA family competence protein [Lentilactobacillus hilgardii]
MLVAQFNGQLIQANEIKLKRKDKHEKRRYVCPRCQEPVMFKHGHSRIAHFSHFSVSECPFNENESQVHLEGKIRFKKEFLSLGHEAVLEHSFTQIGQRADVYIPDSQTVVEYQCSPISFSEIKRRTQGYLSVAKRVFWILGARYNTGIYHRDTVARFSRYHQQLGFYFVCYSDKDQYFRLHYQLKEVAGKIIGETQNFLNLKALLRFLRTSQYSSKKYQIGQNATRRLLLHQLKMIQQSNLNRNRTYLESVTDCYSFRKLFIGCPMICHGNRGSGLPIFNKSVLCWRTWVILRLFDSNRTLLSDEFLKGIFNISYEQFGLAFAQIVDNEPFFKAECRRLIIQLHDQGYIRHTVSGIQILKQPVWFSNYDEKRWHIMTTTQFL